MVVKTQLNVNNMEVTVIRNGKEDYISLTDLARYKNSEYPAAVVIHWLSNMSTILYLGLWENLKNPDFNLTEFRKIKINEAGYDSFTMSPSQWIKRTNAIGMISKGGRYSIGTFAHHDIAFEKNA